MYEIEMVFSASVGFKTINDILRQTGCNDTLQIKDAITISVKQTLPTIPNEEYLRKVADILKNNYETKDYNITECHFTGYRNIREINLKMDGERKDNG